MAALALGVVLALFLSRGAARGDFAPRLSTYRSAPGGSRALYLLAEESGARVQRWQSAYAELPAGTPLVLLGMSFPAGSSGRDGGEIAMSQPDAGLDAPARGAFSGERPGLDAEERKAFLDHVREGASALVLVQGRDQETLLQTLGVKFTPNAPDDDAGDADDEDAPELLPAFPSRYTRGVKSVRAPISGVLEILPRQIPLLVLVDGGVVAALAHAGAGEIVLLASPELATNARLGTEDNAQLWLSLLDGLAQGPGAGRAVAFDELHHGFRATRSVAAFGRRYGLPFALGQLVLGLFAWAASLRRFGPPLRPAAQGRVLATDALAATGRLYRAGRHHTEAAQLLVRATSTALARASALSATASPEQISAALTSRGHAAEAVAYLALMSRPPVGRSDAQLTSLAQEAHRLRRAMHRPGAGLRFKFRSPVSPPEGES